MQSLRNFFRGMLPVVWIWGAIIILFLFLIQNYSSYQTVDSNNQSMQYLNQDLFTSFINQESGLRGFEQSGDTQFLAPVDSGEKQGLEDEAELRKLLTGVSDQEGLRLFHSLLSAEKEWVDTVRDPEIVAVKKQQYLPVLGVLIKDKQLFDQIRIESQKVSDHLSVVSSQARGSEGRKYLLTLTYSFAMLLLLTGITYWQSRKIHLQSITDELTQVYNSRFLSQMLRKTFREAFKNSQPLSLILIDLDHFKNINDTYGHAAGNYVLQKVVERISTHIRKSDYVGRWGGEEFLLILPFSSKRVSIEIAERIRTEISRRPIFYENQEISITISEGVSSYPEDVRSEKDLFEYADQALYQAKSKGRNQVCVVNRLEC